MTRQTFKQPALEAAGRAPMMSSGIFQEKVRTLGLMGPIIASILVHLLLIGLISLTMFILQLLGITVPTMDLIAPKERDVTFVLVDRPEAQPRNKNTKNRADRATRAGGKKVKNMPEAETQRAAGAPASKPSPAPSQSAQRSPSRQASPQRQQQQPRRAAVAQPRQQQQPARPQQQPTPPTPQAQPTEVRRPTPPAPKLPTPAVAQNRNTPALPPNPIAPVIRTPAPPSPKAIAAGPVVRTPGATGGASGGSASGSPGPSQIPGSVSGGSRGAQGGRAGGSAGAGRPGSAGGAGGTGSHNQTGSPGGGGGAAGIDAMPEPDFGPYISELQRRIKRNWMPPTDNRDKRVVAVFTIARDGRLLGIRLSQSSGVKSADDAAMAAIRASAPFRPLPPNYRGQDIDVQFIFDYTVHSAGGISSR